jgi:hypothetical protein
VLRKISNYEHKEIAQPNSEEDIEKPKILKHWDIYTGVDRLICMVMVQSSHKLSSKSFTSISASHKFWWPLHSLDSQTCKDHVPETTTECVTVTHKNQSS